ncbi:unnamed protein product [Zymoseptoria tritici ST99CH_3D1]|uniref:Uncharacterized protein n=2 Tax=Zymoseptoria tritici TaxID=1047171 RepID=A0A1X7RHQ8_ZYMT9|nr:unnamed protein product [Zymoseptoria tritici ST99CH_3D7]SMR43317.1 unnamed protein product [Zymoseptoria tritici ST99CH_1E4]SMR45478.1 unnamed protein product [Zymoseptoria tritici ST99CH_3D1]
MHTALRTASAALRRPATTTNANARAKMAATGAIMARSAAPHLDQRDLLSAMTCAFFEGSEIDECEEHQRLAAWTDSWTSLLCIACQWDSLS